MRSILVTGGSGFFGQAFVKFLLRNPCVDRVCVFSRSEHIQASLRASIVATGRSDPLARVRFFIGDVRDLPRLARAMQGCDTVVHAAALKRIEVGEYCCDELVKTNVIGAMNVIEAAHATPSVSRVVALSTDKAFAPVNAYGASKLLAEKLFLTANNQSKDFRPRFSVVRYGNVFNSTGSIFPKWRELIANGETSVPVTDPECTRFMMRIDEAAQLVWDTLGVMPIDKPVVPRLPAYRVGDLAEAMCVDMEITGLPAFEKRHECMDLGNSSHKARRLTVAELREIISDELDREECGR